VGGKAMKINMWLLNYVTKNSITESSAEKGSIKSVDGATVQVDASSDFKRIPVVVPYGVYYVPPVGEESVVISVGGEDFCLGTLGKEANLSSGELMLRSAGGASIVLKNDGHVYINGVMY
jgi:phage gp45-like